MKWNIDLSNMFNVGLLPGIYNKRTGKDYE
jgi:hypothetical protein